MHSKLKGLISGGGSHEPRRIRSETADSAIKQKRSRDRDFVRAEAPLNLSIITFFSPKFPGREKTRPKPQIAEHLTNKFVVNCEMFMRRRGSCEKIPKWKSLRFSNLARSIGNLIGPFISCVILCCSREKSHVEAREGIPFTWTPRIFSSHPFLYQINLGSHA